MVYTKKSHIVKPRILESLTAFSCSFVFMWPFRGMLYWMFTVDNKDTVIFSLDVILLPLLSTLLISVTVSTLKQCFYIQNYLLRQLSPVSLLLAYSRQLHVQSWQYKHSNKVWNMFKVNKVLFKFIKQLLNSLYK